MTSQPTPSRFRALDACHHQIQEHLDRLAALMDQAAQGTIDAAARAAALEIADFFDTTARQHHADEEEHVFPGLLRHGDAERVAQVRHLIEDHFWIEKYWHDLDLPLRALGQSRGVGDYPAMLKSAQLFHELSSQHIELEESMIYPLAKARAGVKPQA